MSLLPLLLGAALSAGNAEFEQSSTALAADIAVAQLRDEILERNCVTGALKTAMLERPDAFRTRAEAERRCRAVYTNALAGLCRARTEGIARELGVGASIEGPGPSAAEEAARRHFAGAFSRQRAEACAEQAKRIALTVKPDEADLEAKGDDEARSWLTARIAQAKGTAVFEENLKYISEQIVDPVLADARRERRRQQEYLMRTRCDACAPDALAREIEANLRRSVAERNAKLADPLRAWNVFPATLRTALPAAVERRLLALVLGEIDGVPLALDGETVEKAVRLDPSAHRRASDSEAAFRRILSERAAFSAYVRSRANAPELVRAVETRLRREALPKLRKARAALAKEEAARIWPTLSDRTWYPDAELADKTAARSDYAAAVQGWRKAPEMSALAGASKPLLEESDADADASVAAAFDLARSAIAAQRAIVGEVHPDILAAARGLSKGGGFFTRKPGLAEVAGMLTKAVETRWGERREGILWGGGPKPGNAGEQHVRLFPSVRREIELVARQVLDELKREDAKRDEAQEKPEERPSSPEETKPEEEPCTISFEVGGGEATVRASRGGRVVAERKARATAGGFEDAVREVGAIVGREVFKLK